MGDREVNKDSRLTLGNELMEHLGVRPGDKIEAEFLPHGAIRLSAAPKVEKSAAAKRDRENHKSKPD
jgi:uncharacterized RmlC-like cupin family protein